MFLNFPASVNRLLAACCAGTQESRLRVVSQKRYGFAGRFCLKPQLFATVVASAGEPPALLQDAAKLRFFTHISKYTSATNPISYRRSGYFPFREVKFACSGWIFF